MVQDPVCKMNIEKEEAKGEVKYESETYYFCSAECKEEFLKNPDKYVHRKPKRPENTGC